MRWLGVCENWALGQNRAIDMIEDRMTLHISEAELGRCPMARFPD